MVHNGYQEAVDDSGSPQNKTHAEGGDAPIESSDKKLGGAYKDLDFDNSIAPNRKKETVEQRHHMPSQYSGNKGSNGGAITMITDDHKQTASWDNIDGSKEYRQKQKELIEQGEFQEAFEMDVRDVREKFGDKYDEAIEQLRDWYKENGKF
ncbi:hypothetical protein CGC58_01400 [Capnocytophaga stomatis]|uniref:Uncharacterized protein n=1 Tax=Capnocytophaga stomatis TaxID=1848904 RepID=A0A250FX17_9FLAO|nr:hypothetical protein CGC58_01400 [Capnocytophaga stomatis]